ncbi:unnamed protein product [Arabidopsis halleri]
MSWLPYERAGPATTNANYVPTARSNNNHDMLVSRFRPEETTDTISLDIGVGIAFGSPDHTSNEHQQQQHTRSEFIQQTQTNGAAGCRFVHGPLPWDPTMVEIINITVREKLKTRLKPVTSLPFTHIHVTQKGSLLPFFILILLN